jgi:hypothetical protein
MSEPQLTLAFFRADRYLILPMDGPEKWSLSHDDATNMTPEDAEARGGRLVSLEELLELMPGARQQYNKLVRESDSA